MLFPGFRPNAMHIEPIGSGEGDLVRPADEVGIGKYDAHCEEAFGKDHSLYSPVQ